ncbi:aminotransferase class I/II-fold pyridoxal phosphate-dependent enzyme [Aquabacterium sp. A7-Y]|uniref:pyridoxal phosphate-dependent aminotransferase n=1 Tax=Aquabacterium sp. A7-Y TaxID=1349605 RepID=UPI00223E83C2|nr:aminotransferase class I/II-fold pyridoxal phosphate-dependent enzyme [Aquabacterium sp. A7-Y]MCW7536778.1 aminotransferase class I/II-fold pyridoxal phosphate-dependent enzyme [Aquabacterium sp. A7-Y]
MSNSPSRDRYSRLLDLDAFAGVPASILDLGRVGSCEADEMARPRKLKGGDIVPLSGSPRRPPPEHVLAAVEAAMRDTGYAPGRGVPALRQAIAARIEANTGVAPDPETQVVVTNGAMQALHVIMSALLAPGDEVIIPSPCFSYDGLVKLAKAQPVYVPMQADAEYAWDIDRIKQAITPRTKLLIVNTPVNPTGRVLSRDELMKLADVAQTHNILMVADEAYDRLVYDGREHTSLYSLDGMAERTLLVQSATKSFAMGAWRVGWVVAPPALTTIFAKMVEWMMLAANHVAQAAVAAALRGPDAWLHDLAAEFELNRDISVSLLRGIEGMPFVVPQGGPFLLPDVSALGVTGDEFAATLITEHGLRVTGGSYYNSPECIRIPFGGTREAIEETYFRIQAAVRKLPARA